MAAGGNVIEQFNAMPLNKKIALFAVIVISISVMVLLFTWIQKADYQVLYSNLSEEDAGRVVQELRDRKISYQIGAGGAVLVSADEVYDIRLQLASKGIPQGAGVGFEIFDNSSFTTSEFVQKLNYRRALEGELSRTIGSLSGIQQSRVHLVTPDKSVFAFQADKPKASAAVFVTLQQGRKLSRTEVDGIVHLVSSSVEDLGPEDITVVDNKGKLLTKPSDDNMMAMSSTQLEYQHNFEKNMVSKIVSILEPVVGLGKVNAKVSSSFDFTRSERTEESFDPEGVVVRSESKSTEKTTSGFPLSGGIPGVASNLPGGASPQMASSQGQSQKQDEMINYETSKTITRIVDSPVTLERMTVALLIDGILPSQKETMENADQYAVRTEEDIKYYEDIVKKTIGFTEDRGDEISVNVMPFEAIDLGEAVESERDYMPVVYTVLKYVVSVIVALLFFLFVVKPLMKSLAAGPAAPAAARTASAEAVPELGGPMQVKEIPLEKQVVEWADNNPQQAAGLVKGWLEE